MNIPSLIKSLMSLNNLSAQDLAFASQITPATISRYLSGKTDIKSESLIKILKALNIDVNEFLKKALVNELEESKSYNLIASEFNLIFSSLEELDQKTILNLTISSLPSSAPTKLLVASKNLSQYALNLGLRKRYA